MTVRHTAAVVGGGVVGRAIALALGRNGVDTVLLDPAHPEHQPASTAAGAMLGAFGETTAADPPASADSELAARVRAADEYGDWLDSLSGRPPQMRLGTMMVAAAIGVHDRRNVAAVRAALVYYGRDHEAVDIDALPYLRPTSRHPIAEALWIPNEGSVDVVDLMRALAEEIGRHHSVTVIPEAATGLRFERDRVVGVSTDNATTVTADWTVLAAGSRTREILAKYPEAERASPPLLEGKGTGILVHGGPQPPWVVRTPNRAFACGLHLVPRGSSTVYVGATNRLSSRLGATGHATAGELHYLLDAAIHEFNVELADADVTAVTAGSRPVSADRRPVVGVTELPGLAIATGTYRNGILLAPYIADLMATEIESGSSINSNPFSPIGRRELFSVAPPTQHLLAEGAEDVVTMLMEPGGSMPYGRDKDLVELLSVLLPLVESTQDQDVAELWRRTLGDHPLLEMVPELLVVLRQHGRAVR